MEIISGAKKLKSVQKYKMVRAPQNDVCASCLKVKSKPDICSVVAPYGINARA